MDAQLEKLKKDIRKSLADGEAVLALDRLHTFTIKKIRSYCLLHNIDILNDKNEGLPLHSLMGMLIKYYSSENQISEFSIQALKQSISIFEKFNDIRNNKSYAHDNNVLSNEESLYVVSCITNTLNFLNYLETGESQLISTSVIRIEDIYKYICLNEMVTSKKIAEHFKTSFEDIKDLLQELFKVNELIKPGSICCNPEDENCQWIKWR